MTFRFIFSNLLIMFSLLKAFYTSCFRHRPVFLNHKITIRCNSKCKHCVNWMIKEDPNTLLKHGEIESFLDKAAAAGMYHYWVWGGEPLLREDVPDILAYAKKKNLFTCISTNASLLKERALEIIPHINAFNVSLDGIGNTHDEVRGFPGLFDRVINGIEFVKSKKCRTRIIYTVNRMNMDQLEEAAKLARELNVSIFYSTMTTLPHYNVSISVNPETEQEIYLRIGNLKKQGYPVANTYSFVRLISEGRRYQCKFPIHAISVEYDGTLYSCEPGPGRKLGFWGNARTVNFAKLFACNEYRNKTRSFGECNICRQPCAEFGYQDLIFQFPARMWTRLKYD